MSLFTVLLLYPDYIAENPGQEDYLAEVKAKSPRDAVILARAEVAKLNQIETAEDFRVIAVFAGHHEDIKP